MSLIPARLISKINLKINLRDLVGLILVMMHPGYDGSPGCDWYHGYEGYPGDDGYSGYQGYPRYDGCCGYFLVVYFSAYYSTYC